MTAVALFVVFVTAKLFALGSHGVPLSVTGFARYIWEDAAVAAAFGMIACLARSARWGSLAAAAMYATFAAYAAVNIPVGRALGTPLTWPMLRAAAGPLADSMLMYATWTNLGLMLAIAILAAGLPRLLRRLPRSVPVAASGAALLTSAIVAGGEGRADAAGRERNVVVALLRSSIEPVRANAAEGAWRLSPFTTDREQDLSLLRGAARGRNVVFVSLESTAAQYLPLYGSRDDVMPALEGLGENALVFERAYAAYPESIKGLFSILCSMFPAFDVDAIRLSRTPCAALPERLRSAGYRTALFHSGRFAYLGMDAVVAGRGFDRLEDAGAIGGNHASSFGIDEPATVARMLQWIDSLSDRRPFFLAYLPIAGHHPYEVPAGISLFPNDEEFGRYRNALRYGDESLGALVAGLRARGMSDNTIWVVAGDHGEAFGQHDGNYGHTFFLYDENVRVPLLIAAPGVISGRTRIGRVVSLVDVAPTILDLLGLPIPAAYQGATALDPSPRMALFFTDYSLRLAGLVDGLWKAIGDVHSGRTRLFHLGDDPRETTDRSSALPARAAWYSQRLRDWSGAQKHYVLTATPSAGS